MKNYFQNHRRYYQSRSILQLQGQVTRLFMLLWTLRCCLNITICFTTPQNLGSSDVELDCNPLYKNGSMLLNPCGLIANSFFTGKYVILAPMHTLILSHQNHLFCTPLLQTLLPSMLPLPPLRAWACLRPVSLSNLTGTTFSNKYVLFLFPFWSLPFAWSHLFLPLYRCLLFLIGGGVWLRGRERHQRVLRKRGPEGGLQGLHRFQRSGLSLLLPRWW